MLKNSSQGFGLVSIALHWVSAVLVLGLFALGLYMTSLSYYDTWYHKGPWWHVSFGLLLMLLTLVRLVWRGFNPNPAPLDQHRGRTILATSVKHLLYLTLIVVMLTGYLINTAEARPASFFGWLDVPALARFDGAAVDLLGRIHLFGAWLMMVLVAAHAGAALLHHFVWKDATLRRMLRPVRGSQTKD